MRMTVEEMKAQDAAKYPYHSECGQDHAKGADCVMVEACMDADERTWRNAR